MRTQFLALLVLGVVLSGCASVPVAVTGNNSCLPSDDLPKEKVLPDYPEQDLLFEDFFGEVAKMRERHSKDVMDYNSLYNLCVVKVPAQEQK